MILRNLNKTSINSYTDIRTGTTGFLIPDPFTVTWANTGFSSITYDSNNDRYYSSYSSDPVTTYFGTIASAFGAQKVIIDNMSQMTLEEKVYWIAYYITNYPQGVGIVFNNSSNGTHIIVGVGTTLSLDYGKGNGIAFPKSLVNDAEFVDPINTEEQNNHKMASIQRFVGKQDRSVCDITYGEFFTVCDPVSTFTNPGQYVNLNLTWTATEYTLDDVQSLRLLY